MVVDGHAVVHRAFHAVRQELTTSRGELTNAVFGFAAILLDGGRPGDARD